MFYNLNFIVDKAEPLMFNFQNYKKVNESLEHIPSAKLYQQEAKGDDGTLRLIYLAVLVPGKRKRVKSARIKDSKAKSSSKSK